VRCGEGADVGGFVEEEEGVGVGVEEKDADSAGGWGVGCWFCLVIEIIERESV
jgi:hypothetical protein